MSSIALTREYPRRRSQLSASVAGETCFRPRCSCVCACARVNSKHDGVTLRVAVRAQKCAACAMAQRLTVHHPTDGMQDGSSKGQEAVCDRGRAVCNMQQRTACRRRHERDNVQETTGKCKPDNMRRGTCDGKNATDDTPHATHNSQTTCAMHAGNMQRITTTCNAQGSMQYAACNRPQTTWKRQ